jgi:hypothetical protein
VIKHGHLLQTIQSGNPQNPTPFNSMSSILILPIPGKPMEYLQQQYTKQLLQQENQSYSSRFKSSRSSSNSGMQLSSNKDAVIFWNETVLAQYIQSIESSISKEEKDLAKELDTISAANAFNLTANFSSRRLEENENEILQGVWSAEERSAYVQIVKRFLYFNDWIQSCGVCFPQVIILWLQSFLASISTISYNIANLTTLEEKIEKKHKKHKRKFDETAENDLNGLMEPGNLNLSVNEFIGIIISKCYTDSIAEISKVTYDIASKINSLLLLLHISQQEFLDDIIKVNSCGMHSIHTKQKSSLLQEYSVHFPSYSNQTTIWSKVLLYFMQPKLSAKATELRKANMLIEEIINQLKQEEFRWQLLTTTYLLTCTTSTSRKRLSSEIDRPNLSTIIDELLQKLLTILLKHLPSEIDSEQSASNSESELSEWLEYTLSLEIFTFYTSHAASSLFVTGDDYLLHIITHCCESIVSILEYLYSHDLLRNRKESTSSSAAFKRFFNAFVESSFYLLLHRIYLILQVSKLSPAGGSKICELLHQLFDFSSEYTLYLVANSLPYAYTLYFGVYVLPLLRPTTSIKYADEEDTIRHRNTFQILFNKFENIVFSQGTTVVSNASTIFPCYWYLLSNVSVDMIASKKKSLSMLFDVLLSEWSNNSFHDVTALPNIHSTIFTHQYGISLHQEKLLPSLRTLRKLHLSSKDDTSNGNAKHILSFPSEILVHIFSFCSYKRMCRLTCVHSYFAKIISMYDSTNTTRTTRQLLTSEYFPYHERLWRELYYRAFPKVKYLDDLLTPELQQVVASDDGIIYCHHCFPTTEIKGSDSSLKHRYVTACCANAKEMHHWQWLMKVMDICSHTIAI